MGFLRKIAGLLGLAKDEAHEVKEEDEDDADDHHHHQNRVGREEIRGPRRGFSVPVQVPVERPQIGPVLIPCGHGEGGIQGLRWFAKRLRIDEDGDVADEFFNEVLPETSSSLEGQHKPLPKFEVKYSTRPAKVKKQAMSLDGKIQQYVEYQGRLQWV
ncbi:hypothetical protein L1049_027172 [Liquidambar formosana]|uniref:Uncharacterized protein n=1 Tax=Liquidambar formosana TaxID=63359 RepID=A0AAP0N5G2_LIQFO